MRIYKIYFSLSRDNLDPDHQLPDEELYSVLEKVHLKEAIRSIGGLGFYFIFILPPW